MPCPIKPMALHSLHGKRRASQLEHELSHPLERFIIPASDTGPTLTSLSGVMKRLKVDDSPSASQLSSLCFNSMQLEFKSGNVSNFEVLDNVIRDNNYLQLNVPTNPNESSTFSPVDIESIFRNEENGNNRLHASILRGQAELAIRMISMAPSFDYMSIENAKGQTALHMAVITNQPALVRRLICAGAAVDVVDEDGNTPLHLACKLGYIDIARHLLRPVDYKETVYNNYTIPFQRIPQDMDLTDNDGLTCLHLASMHNHFKVVKMIIQSGACYFNTENIIESILGILSVSRDFREDSSSESEESEGEENEEQRDPIDFHCQTIVNTLQSEHDASLSDEDLSIVRKQRNKPSVILEGKECS